MKRWGDTGLFDRVMDGLDFEAATLKTVAKSRKPATVEKMKIGPLNGARGFR